MKCSSQSKEISVKGLLGRIWKLAYAQIDLKNVTLRIQDGSTPSPNHIDVTIGEGNFTYDETKNRDYQLDRGKLNTVRDGDEAPMDISFDFIWDYITGSSDSGAIPTVEDALKRKGPAADWATTDSDPCAPYCVDLILLNVPICTAEGDKETLTFPDFRYEKLAHDTKAGTVACTGKCNAVEPTVLREPNTSPSPSPSPL